MKLSISFLKQALPHSGLYVDGCNISSESDNNITTLPKLLNGELECDFSIDTRTILPGQAFIAFQGESTDGHNFVLEAVEKGARALIINKNSEKCIDQLSEDQRKKIVVISVRDTLHALIEMARNWRQRFNYPVVAITGSMGKTTTKEMIGHMLDIANISALISYKNQNTIIGLSLNILRMRKEHKAAIFELGINKKGEMSMLADVLRPSTALITNVAHAHTGFLGSISEISGEKRNVFKYFNSDNIGIICGDQAVLDRAYYHHPVVKFGLKVKNQVQARNICIKQHENISFSTNFLLKVYKDKKKVTLKGNHSGRVYNALGAASVAHFLNVPFNEIVSGMETFTGYEGCFEFKDMKNGYGMLISDCYNANPESMRAALLAFQDMRSSGVKVAVLGDMLELGEKERFWHRQVGRILSRVMSIDRVILVGSRSKAALKTAPVTMKLEWCETWQQASKSLENILTNNSLVLVKGSHGMKLSKLVDVFT